MATGYDQIRLRSCKNYDQLYLRQGTFDSGTATDIDKTHAVYPAPTFILNSTYLMKLAGCWLEWKSVPRPLTLWTSYGSNQKLALDIAVSICDS